MRPTLPVVLLAILVPAPASACGGPDAPLTSVAFEPTELGAHHLTVRWTGRTLEVAPDPNYDAAAIRMPGRSRDEVNLRLTAPLAFDPGYLELDPLGLPDDASWRITRPMFLYAVNVDDTDEELHFALSPSPGLGGGATSSGPTTGASLGGGVGPINGPLTIPGRSGRPAPQVLLTASQTRDGGRQLDRDNVTLQRIGMCPMMRTELGWVLTSPCRLGTEEGLFERFDMAKINPFSLVKEPWESPWSFRDVTYDYQWVTSQDVELRVYLTRSQFDDVQAAIRLRLPFPGWGHLGMASVDSDRLSVTGWGDFADVGVDGRSIILASLPAGTNVRSTLRYAPFATAE